MKKKFCWVLAAVLLLGVVLLLAACTGDVGPAGTAGPTGASGTPGTPGKSSGAISGTITSSLTQKPVAGVTVATDPVIKDVTIASGADGGYSAELPIGTYQLTFKKDNFTAATETVVLVAGQTVTKDVVLKPAAAVKVDAGQDQNASPEGSVVIKVKTESFDGSTVTGYKWTQIAGVTARIDKTDADTITVTLDKAKDYKAALLAALEQQDRFTVQAINPHALETAEIATFKVTVTTSSGTYSDTVNVVAELPYVVNGGLANVPVGLPVLMHGKTQINYNWALTVPNGSQSVLDKSSDQNPSFTPDVGGKYVLTEEVSGATIDVSAGTWAGAISGLDTKGRPVSEGCTICHNGTLAPDKFTDWKASGHAEIFTQNLNTSSYYSEGCFSCHAVGFDKTVANGGFDDASDYTAFLDGGLLGKPSLTNWSKMLTQFPKAAQLANIQCESCHGPNNSPLHANGTVDTARVSLSADACGACHGEPLRHGRFQQWEESKHADFTLATTRGTSAHCGRCHTAQGFLTWIEQGDLTKQIQGANGNATAAEMIALGAGPDTAQPQTCAVCHDPHQQGTTSGEPNTATIRITGDTAMLPAGFQAKEVGKGALCMTCHNTRNTTHNDAYPPTSYSAPHTAAQADMLMGENAYFVAEGQRSPHSYIKDTCVTCHMEESPPPAEFSYNLSGTNHAFEASTAICSSCHAAALNAKALEEGVEAKVERLGHKMSEYLLSQMPATITVKDYTPHNYTGKSYDVLSDAMVVSKDNIEAVEPTEPHGQQGFIIKFKSSLTFTYKPAGEDPHSVSMSEAEVRLGDITTDGKTALIPFTDVLVKVGWNYFLIHGDGSEGIHNPPFANAVLDASIAALK